MTRRAANAQQKPPVSQEVDIEALLREAEAADAAARATLPTPEEERVIIAAAEALGAIGGGEAYLEEILEAGDYVDEDVQNACNKAHGSW